MQNVFKQLESVAKRIVKVSSTLQGTSVLRSSSKRSHRTDKRLQDLLQNPSSSCRQLSSQKKQPIFAATVGSGDGIEEEPLGAELEPGSFLEIRNAGRILHGVVLKMVQDARQISAIVLGSSGEVYMSPQRDVTFVIPGFIDLLLLDRCGKTLHTSDPQAITARSKVLHKSRQFERAVEAAYHALGRKILTLYPRVKSADPEEWSELETYEAARLLDTRPNLPIFTVFAVHKQLMTRHKEFVADSVNHRHTHTFRVRPQRQIEETEKIHQWVRSQDVACSSFIQKSQHIIDEARRISNTSINELPAAAQVELPPFSSDDKGIIRFLERYNTPDKPVQDDVSPAYVSTIMKQVKRYDDLVKSAALIQYLHEIGVTTPWDDVLATHSVLLPPDRDQPTRSPAVIKEKPTQEKTTPQFTPKSQMSTDGFYAVDELDSLRHDFGGLPVYVIDDLTAEELDDGLSLEAVPDDPDKFWIHVHIADPTAVLPPEHALVARARRQMESIYLVHETYPMLPGEVHDRDVGLRQSSQSEVKGPKKVMTFSFKVDQIGDITDYKVRAALVRDVRVVDYDTVSALLGSTTPDFYFPFASSAGGFPSSSEAAEKLPLVHQENLRTLMRITRRLREFRSRTPFLMFHRETANISMNPRPPPRLPPELDSPRLFRGFPRLTYAVGSHPNLERSSRWLVSECMIGACRVASRFFRDNGIPMIRRATRGIDASSNEALEDLLAQRGDSNFVDLASIISTGFKLPMTEYTLNPSAHWSLGIPEGEGYVRVTSPLRRFGDLVAHWQIKQALLRSAGAKKLPFDETDLAQIHAEMQNFERANRSFSTKHMNYWAHMYIHRYLQQLDGAAANNGPLTSIRALTLAQPHIDGVTLERYTLVHLHDLGMRARLFGDNPEYQPGTPLLVSVQEVRMGLSPFVVVNRANV